MVMQCRKGSSVYITPNDNGVTNLTRTPYTVLVILIHNVLDMNIVIAGEWGDSQ